MFASKVKRYLHHRLVCLTTPSSAQQQLLLHTSHIMGRDAFDARLQREIPLGNLNIRLAWRITRSLCWAWTATRWCYSVVDISSVVVQVFRCGILKGSVPKASPSCSKVTQLLSGFFGGSIGWERSNDSWIYFAGGLSRTPWAWNPHRDGRYLAMCEVLCSLHR